MGTYLNLGVINKNGQIVNSKIFFGMLGTIPNYEFENIFVFLHTEYHDSMGTLIAYRLRVSEVVGSLHTYCLLLLSLGMNKLSLFISSQIIVLLLDLQERLFMHLNKEQISTLNNDKECIFGESCSLYS